MSSATPIDEDEAARAREELQGKGWTVVVIPPDIMHELLVTIKPWSRTKNGYPSSSGLARDPWQGIFGEDKYASASSGRWQRRWPNGTRVAKQAMAKLQRFIGTVFRCNKSIAAPMVLACSDNIPAQLAHSDIACKDGPHGNYRCEPGFGLLPIYNTATLLLPKTNTALLEYRSRQNTTASYYTLEKVELEETEIPRCTMAIVDARIVHAGGPGIYREPDRSARLHVYFGETSRMTFDVSAKHGDTFEEYPVHLLSSERRARLAAASIAVRPRHRKPAPSRVRVTCQTCGEKHRSYATMSGEYHATFRCKRCKRGAS